MVKKMSNKKKDDLVIESSSIRSKFDIKHPKEKRKLLEIYEDFLTKLGLETNPRVINESIVKSTLAIMFCTCVIILSYGYTVGTDMIDLFIPLTVFVTFSLGFLSYVGLHLLVLGFLELRLLKHTREIEEYLPDFLQLASVNISAGLPIDRALWFSVRNKFGVLAVEIEKIAKETVAGKELGEALVELSNKYNSNTLKESVNLINEGIRSGGELSELLNKISENIYETRLMKKEIAASVMTYAIFIGVGSVLAAPLLLALSTQLLNIVTDITANLDFDGGAGFQTFSFNTDGISIFHFQLFSVLVIVLTALFSASIVNVIRKGNVKEGFKSIPLFIVVALTIYLFATLFFNRLLGGIV